MGLQHAGSRNIFLFWSICWIWFCHVPLMSICCFCSEFLFCLKTFFCLLLECNLTSFPVITLLSEWWDATLGERFVTSSELLDWLFNCPGLTFPPNTCGCNWEYHSAWGSSSLYCWSLAEGRKSARLWCCSLDLTLGTLLLAILLVSSTGLDCLLYICLTRAGGLYGDAL